MSAAHFAWQPPRSVREPTTDPEREYRREVVAAARAVVRQDPVRELSPERLAAIEELLADEPDLPRLSLLAEDEGVFAITPKTSPLERASIEERAPTAEAITARTPGRRGQWPHPRALPAGEIEASVAALQAQGLATHEDRPRTRAECPTTRPCGFVSCRYHLYLEADPRTGAVKLNHPGIEVWKLQESCALDAAARGGLTLEQVGQFLGVTRERIRQIEAEALARFKDSGLPVTLRPPAH